MSAEGAPSATSARLRAWLLAASAGLREWLSLSDAERRAKALDHEAVAKLTAALAESERHRVAAELLWSSGAEVEAFRNATAAFLALDTVVDPELLAEPRAPLRSACSDAAKEPDEGLFEDLLGLQGALADRIWPLTLDAKARSATRLRRRAGVGSMVVALGFVLGWWWQHEAVSVAASSSWGGKFSPNNVIDDDETTHWVLPDHSTGWIELRFRRAQRVREVRLLNGYDPASYGIVDFRLEASIRGRVVKTLDGTFAGQPYGSKLWHIMPFVTGVPVDAIRVVVKSGKDLGASLAEIQFD